MREGCSGGHPKSPHITGWRTIANVFGPISFPIGEPTYQPTLGSMFKLNKGLAWTRRLEYKTGLLLCSLFYTRERKWNGRSASSKRNILGWHRVFPGHFGVSFNGKEYHFSSSQAIKIQWRLFLAEHTRPMHERFRKPTQWTRIEHMRVGRWCFRTQYLTMGGVPYHSFHQAVGSKKFASLFHIRSGGKMNDIFFLGGFQSLIYVAPHCITPVPAFVCFNSEDMRSRRQCRFHREEVFLEEIVGSEHRDLPSDWLVF